MTGPLANEFAQVRARLRPVQGLDGVQCQCEDCSDNAAGFAALARIEEHTHNTEKALRFMEDFIIDHGLHDEMVEAGKPAALSAGEGTPA